MTEPVQKIPATARRLVKDKNPSGDTALLGAHPVCGGLRTLGSFKRSVPEQPLISIILPVLNGMSSFERCLASVFHQTYDNIELIVIDGGSADGTVNTLREHNETINLWVSESDQGVYDAMNKGIGLARGDWLYFLGVDDVLRDSIHLVAPYLNRPDTVCYGNVHMMTRGVIYDGAFNANKLMHQNICHQAIFYPARVFSAYRYNLKYERLADYFLNIQCWNDRRFRFVHVPAIIADYCEEGFSSKKADEAFRRDWHIIVKAFPGYRGYKIRAWILQKWHRALQILKMFPS